MSVYSQTRLFRVYQDDPSQAVSDVTRLRAEVKRLADENESLNAEITRLRALVAAKDEALASIANCVLDRRCKECIRVAETGLELK